MSDGCVKMRNEDKIKIFKEFYKSNADKIPALQVYKKNGDYYFHNMQKIRKKHGGNFIVILKNDVYASARNYKELSKILDKLGKRKSSHAFVSYVPKEKETLVA